MSALKRKLKTIYYSFKCFEALKLLLLMIEYETGLPESGANGVTHNGIDEGIVKCGKIISEAQNIIIKIDGHL